MEGLQNGPNGSRVRFGDYEFDPELGKLLRNGLPVKIQPQPLRVLAVLLERSGEIVSRDELCTRVWGDATYVEFDQGLNYCIRQIRLALRDGAAKPRFIETLPKQGYRFIAASEAANRKEADAAAQVKSATERAIPQGVAVPLPDAATLFPPQPARKRLGWGTKAGICTVLAIVAVAVYASLRIHPAGVTFTQLTDFTDSAVAPVLSPDGHMLAFIRGNKGFVTADQIYVKVLPDGEARRVTDDPRLKYSPAFSPDGSQILYTVMEAPDWSTYAVSVLGGDSHLLLKNAAGLTWLDRSQLLFSRTRFGQHMGIVTGSMTRGDFRELYFPPHERAMAHYSYASPDRKSALVVEMDGQGRWAPCLLISLDVVPSHARPIGPQGACLSAAFSPDGSWMYFTAAGKEQQHFSAALKGQEHLWRQRFPDGLPEQITFGPTEEEGVAVEPDGRSVITSMGLHESAIWIHDDNGERSLSSEGEIVTGLSPPSFSADGKVLFYLLRHRAAGSGQELWRMMVDTGKSEAVFPGIDVLAYDVSPDGKQVAYSTAAPGVDSELWLGAIDRSSAARRIGHPGDRSPHFGSRGQILFQVTEGNFSYLEQMNPDGSGRSKMVPYPVGDVQSISPGRRWVVAIVPRADNTGVAPMAIPVDGGPPRLVCTMYCVPKWSSSGQFFFVPVDQPSRLGPGRSLAIPVGPEESLPEFPPGGIKPLAEASVVPGSQSFSRADFVPGRDPSHFAYVHTAVHRNLYRITLP